MKNPNKAPLLLDQMPLILNPKPETLNSFNGALKGTLNPISPLKGSRKTDLSGHLDP